MFEDRYERPTTIYNRAEPDDEYDPRPEPQDPYLTDQDEIEDGEDTEILDEDEDED